MSKEELAKLILDLMEEQSPEAYIVSPDGRDDWTIVDGHFNFMEIARLILECMS